MRNTIRAGAVGVGLALAVTGGVVTTSAVASTPAAVGHLPANADNPNHPDYWKAYLEAAGYTNVECTKDDTSYNDGYTVPAGDWLLLVLKAGAGEDQNHLIWNPVPGQTYHHDSGKDISHVILCTGDEPTEPTEPEPTEPAPTEPEPTEPEPTEPEPTEPAPTEPEPTEPAPTEPAPTEPEPTEPAPTTPDEPEPTGPVVETDGVASGDGGPSTGLVGGAALLLAGGALTFAGVRRRGEH